MVPGIQIWSKSGRQLLWEQRSARGPQGLRAAAGALALGWRGWQKGMAAGWAWDDQGEEKKKIKETKLWIFSLMCLATCECLVLISVLSSQQHSEQRKCYDSHLAQMGTWGCENAQESLGWSRQLSLWSLISNQMFAPRWPSIRGCARSLEKTPIGWAGFVPSAVGCVPRLLSTLCWENPPKQQSVFEL